MKCTLELRGIEYPSVEYTDRTYTNLVAALGGCVGFDVLSPLKAQLKSMGDVVLREYTSLMAAETDSEYLIKKIFPTFTIALDDLTAVEVMGILQVLVEAFTPPTPPAAMTVEQSFVGFSPEEVIAVNYAIKETDHAPVTVANAWRSIKTCTAVADDPKNLAVILDRVADDTGISYDTIVKYRTKIQGHLDHQKELDFVHKSLADDLAMAA